jgi:hypothetical protein
MKAYSNIIGLDISGSTIKFLYPKLISSSMLMTQQKFEEKIEGLKKASAEKFDSIDEFTYYDIDNWLVEYTNKNQDIKNMLQNLSIDYREFEGELFNIKVKQEVIIAPLGDYIEEWLKKYVSKIS